MSAKIVKDFTKGKIMPQLVAFATPLFLSSILQMLYNMADMIIVGRYCGTAGLAAVAVGGDLTNFAYFVSMGLSNAGQVILAQLLGAGQREKIGRFIATMSCFLLGFSLCLTLLGIVLLPELLGLMHTPVECLAATGSYTLVMLCGLPFIFGYNMVAAILRGVGDARHPFIFIALASVLNVLLDLLLIAVLGWGPRGAAVATVISQAVSFLACGIFLWHHRREFYVALPLSQFFRPDRGLLLKFLQLGIPMAVKSASVHSTKLFVNSWINSFGVAVAAVAGIANKFNAVSNLCSNAFNTAGSSMVGQNIGAEKYARVPKILWCTFLLVAGIVGCFALTVVGWPEAVFGIFIGDEPQLLPICLEYVPFALLMFAGTVVRAPMNALINGSGNYKMNFLTALFDGLVFRIGASYFFWSCMAMGYHGLWLGDAVAGFTPLWVGGAFLLTGKWRTNKYIVEKEK